MLRSMLPLYRELMQAGLRILVYSGDVDAIVPGEGLLLKLRLERWKGVWVVGAGQWVAGAAGAAVGVP